MRFLVGLVFLTSAAPLAAQSAVDTSGTARLIDQAMNRSQVMQNLQHLSDVIGPRLSGSPAMRRANDWTAERFRAYGLTAALEPYQFGVAWERGPATLRLTAPFSRAVTAHSWAWTTGTGGKTLSGPVVLTDLSTPESLAVYKRKVKGSWVLPRAPFPIWNPDGPTMTAADSADLDAQIKLRQSPFAATSPPAIASRRQFQIDLPYILKSAGALGTILDGAKEQGLMTMSGSPSRVAPLPSLVISHEDYALLARLIEAQVTPRLEGRVEN